MSAHPGELALRGYLAGEGRPETRAAARAHLLACVDCQARLDALVAEREAFLAGHDFESFARGVEAARERLAPGPARPRTLPRPRLAWPRLALPGLALAAAGLLLLVTPLGGGDAAGPDRLKGGAAVSFYVGGAGASRPAVPPESLGPDERVRVELHPAGRAYAAVLSVDAQGEVSALWPEAGRSLPVPEDPWLLPGSVAFSGTGAERVWVLLSDAPQPVARLQDALRAAWEAADGRVEAMAPPALDGEWLTGTFWKP